MYKTKTTINLMRAASLGVIGLVCGFTPATYAASGSTTVTQTVLPGVLTLTTPATAIMNSLTLNGTASQSATGSLGTSTVTDGRGTGAGWSLTATTTPFTSVGVPVAINAAVGGIVTTGAYTGLTSGSYIVTILAGGLLGTATYSVSGLETSAASLTGIGVNLGSRGLGITFAPATYVAGEQWRIDVNVIPASNLTITPSAVSAIAGSGSNVTAGSSYTYSTGSDPATIMTAAAGSGLGSYADTPGLTLSIPAGTKIGTYAATVTETAS